MIDGKILTKVVVCELIRKINFLGLMLEIDNEEDVVAEIEDDLEKIAQIIRHNIDEITNIDYGEVNGLLKAMRYSSLSEGKMVRAYLVYLFCNILGVSYVAFIRIATAIELVHCYSLVHDDLPSMDNDEYRRGKKSCHKEYDESTAILVGDALQSLAFEILSHPATADDPYVVITLVSELASNIGYNGMSGGQYLDIHDKTTSSNKVIHMQKLKTGKLIEFACKAPGLIAIPPSSVRLSVMNFAHDIGIAYQIKDDLLDVKGDKKKLGKETGKDSKKGKKNLIDFLGVDRAENQLNLLLNQAKNHLNIFGSKAKKLQLFVEYLRVREK